MACRTLEPFRCKGETRMFKKIGRYFKECWFELKKVSWPSRQVVLQSTWVVLASTLVFALLLSLVDIVLGLGLDLLF